MNDLSKDFKGLDKALQKENVLLWSNEHRIVRNKTFSIYREGRKYPFLKKIYDAVSNYRKVVIQKPTQVGATELALNATLFFLDTTQENAMYMLPTKGQLSDFSHQRIDRAVEQSPYLGEMFPDITNVGLKQSKNGALYLRGARTKSGLEEVPVGCLVRDELDRMDEENADLALKRLGASRYKWRIDLSHPTYPDAPINREYKNSSRGRWHIKCPKCGETQTLDWEANYYNPGELVCRECGEGWNKKTLWENGSWVHSEPDNPMKGFQFSQLLSPTVSFEEQRKEYEKAQSEGGYKLEQFYNTVLGMPFAVEGTKLTREKVHNLQTFSKMGEVIPDRSEEPVMGVDVGNQLHYWIQAGDCVYEVGYVESFNSLKRIIERFNVVKVVVDAMPETRKAREFINSLPCRGWICRRSDKLESGRTIKKKSSEIKVNMTEHFDKFFAQFNNEEIKLPTDLPIEAIDHLIAPVRTIEERGGQKVAVWKKGTCHIADAGAYAKEAQIGGKSDKKSGFLW